MSMIYGGSNITFPDGSTQNVAPNGFGFKNRIINGSMMIDQRNAGASVTQTTVAAYLVDRFYCQGSVSSKFTAQQNAGSVTPPVGFTNYLGATSSSAYSVGASEAFYIRHVVEGLNVADLGWGTANAQPITISFWVRSSLTGTFGLGIGNNGFSRTYAAAYTINSANTWEYKTITIAGDTTGTWLTTNGVGIQVTFCLGYGASLQGTAGVWNAGSYFMPTGATSVVGTNGATFYITGVQLEKGSTATSFDYRPYGTELALCQRYYEKSYDIGTASGTASAGQIAFSLDSAQNGVVYANVNFKVTKRATPTVSLWSYTGTSGRWSGGDGADLTANAAIATWANGLNQGSFSLQNTSGGTLTPAYSSIFGAWAASAEL